MKFLIFIFLILTSVWANDKVAPSPNPASGGSDEMSGFSDGPLGPNEEEKQEVKKRAETMGGAPNVGGGMGTGTGAGSTVGEPVKEGDIDEDEED